jgi:hypothetical protein
MAVTVSSFRQTKDDLWDGARNFATSTAIRAFLVNGYTFDATDVFISDTTGEVTTNGGNRHADINPAITFSGNDSLMDTDDLVWTAAGGTLSATGVIIYEDVGGADTARRVLFYIDFGATVSAGDGTQLKVLTASGVVKIA